MSVERRLQRLEADQPPVRAVLRRMQAMIKELPELPGGQVDIEPVLLWGAEQLGLDPDDVLREAAALLADDAA